MNGATFAQPGDLDTNKGWTFTVFSGMECHYFHTLVLQYQNLFKHCTLIQNIKVNLRPTCQHSQASRYSNETYITPNTLL